MKYSINAWLEQRNPVLSITDQESGKTVLQWDSVKLKWLNEQGFLSFEEVVSVTGEATNQWVSELIDLDRVACRPVSVVS